MAILVQSNKKPSVSFPSQTGSIVTFNSQYAGLPLKSHKIALTATQSGSGTPSPSNIRSINGHSVINIGAVGKNFLESNQDLIKAANGGANTWTDNKKTISNIEVTLLDDGGINLNGTASGNTVIMLHTRFAVLDYPSTMKMYIGTQSSINGLSLRISSADLPGSQLICTNPSIPITIPDIKINNADVFIFVNGTTQLTNVKVYPMILLSTETDINYVSFNGTYTTIQIGSTVYGGEYDARTGVLTVTHGIVTYDNNNMPYMQIDTISGGVKTRVFIRQSGVSQDVLGVPDMLCNIANPVEVNAQYTGSEGIAIRVNANVNNQGFYIYDEDIQTLTEWQDYINNNSITVAYPVATPQTLQLPPCPIDTLEGVNNIWADTGETTAQYIKIGG